MSSLAPVLRKKLADAVRDARDVAETGARTALKHLAVHAAEPFDHLTAAEKELRNRLRAHARQLGDARDRSGSHRIDHLVVECAYQHWHQMLFARFLAENDVLIANSEKLGLANASITLLECQDLAREEGAANGWELAARYASVMLPKIFRPGAPVLAVRLPPERQRRLELILAGLPVEVFKASDALGWVYQFWQAKKKAEIQAAGGDVGADELPSVTQLFTEPYMVGFIIHNTIGAWWAYHVLDAQPDLAANARSENELRAACRLPAQEWPFLRFVRVNGRWRPATQRLDTWPQSLKMFSVLDPCCGSGHFLVSAFNALVSVRMQTENLSVQEAIGAVLSENLFGLDIDPRVTEIAAFSLALAAWTHVGSRYGALPSINIACSGLAPRSTKKEWLALCGPESERVRNAMSALYSLFSKAPTLGSLVDPSVVGEAGTKLKLFEGQLGEARKSLRGALRSGATSNEDDLARSERVVAAQGVYEAAELLSRQYDLVVTNVPYLTHTLMDATLSEFCGAAYPSAKADLATVMQARCNRFLRTGGMVATVVPATWMTYTKYFKAFRIEQLKHQRWHLVAMLGKRAFETIDGEIVDVCLYFTSRESPSAVHEVAVIDARKNRTPAEKSATIASGQLAFVQQLQSLKSPGAAFDVTAQSGSLLSQYVSVYEGLSRGDAERFDRYFWELPTERLGPWRRFVESPKETGHSTGRSSVFFWEDGHGELSRHPSARVQGTAAWGRAGVHVSRTHMNATLSYGDAHAQNCVAIVPLDASHLPAIWAFCQSGTYRAGVLALNQKLVKPTGVMDKMPFDLLEWTRSAQNAPEIPDTLPASSDPTQWSFDPSLAPVDSALQVAVASLLGYRWPSTPNAGHDDLSDDDGIVCIPSVRGEAPAADRLVDLLGVTHGTTWSTKRLDDMLSTADASGKDVDWWLRNKFFEQHCKLFKQRPFIWHIWDGIKKDGFSALVNYHKLDRKILEQLAYSYLGDWIRRQQDEVDRKIDGAAERLAAARSLQKQLTLIVEGEGPLDIFVRWKPADQQPLGWEPDLNDGVRMNIRPFLSVPDVDRKGAGILRCRPTINWGIDDGSDPPTAPWYDLGPVYAVSKGSRINHHNLTLDEKRAARATTGDRR